MYIWTSLFAEFLSTDSLIHIGKMVQNDNFPVKNGFFIYELYKFAVQNDGTTRETCIMLDSVGWLKRLWWIELNIILSANFTY